MVELSQTALWVVGLAPLCQVVEGLTQGGFFTAGVRPDHPATFPLLQGSWGRGPSAG